LGNCRPTSAIPGLTGAGNRRAQHDEQNANGQQYAPQIGQYAGELLGGGGATDQAGNVNANYQRYVDQTNPLASNTNYNPYDTPGFKDAINTQTPTSPTTPMVRLPLPAGISPAPIQGARSRHHAGRGSDDCRSVQSERQ
jgi:hypothetical protein